MRQASSIKSLFFFKYLVYSSLIFSIFFGCQPKNLSNISIDQKQENAFFSCDDLNSALTQLENENRTGTFRPSSYDNSSFPYFVIEPGQVAVTKDTILVRLNKDIDYERFLSGNQRFKIKLFVEENDLQSRRVVLDSLVIDQAYYSKNRAPYFSYKFPIKAEKVLGQKLSLSILSDESDCQKEVIVQLACCGGDRWKNVELKRVIDYPVLNISPKTYHYAGFTGVLDIQFENNSPAIRDARLMLERVQKQIDRFKDLDYKIEEINISGYASIKGDAKLNKELSTSRAKALYEGLITRNPDVNIQYEGLGEDWKLTQKLIHQLNDQSDSASKILEGDMFDDEKEAALYALNWDEEVWNEILASTRHTVALLKFSYQGKGASLTSYPDSLPLESEVLNKAALWQVDVGPYVEGIDVERQLAAISTLINEKPTGELYAMRADYFRVQGHYREAFESIRKADEIDGPKWQAFRWAIQLDRFKSLSNTEIQGLSRELISDSSKVFSDNPRTVYRAVLQDQLGNLHGAYQTWQQLSEVRSLAPSELNNLATVCLKTQQLHLAEDYLGAALVKNNKLVEAHYNQAVLYAYKGLTEKSTTHIRQIIALKPEWKDDILSNPAFQYVKLDARFEAAVEGYER